VPSRPSISVSGCVDRTMFAKRCARSPVIMRGVSNQISATFP
jgi:hypothetical protein